MHNVHLDIPSLSVESMLGGRVEVDLNGSVELLHILLQRVKSQIAFARCYIELYTLAAGVCKNPLLADHGVICCLEVD